MKSQLERLREQAEIANEVSPDRARGVLAVTRLPAVPPARALPGDEVFVLSNPRMKRLYAELARAAQGNLPVLILGETGVGKEHVARALHTGSERRDQPFVAINCAALPPTLLESTLFGHERGAFTGATQRVSGVFERADGGVLFLDEVGDLAPAAQVALLRAIETRRVSRVGSQLEISLDLRVVTATHCDLEAMVEVGTFRRDLYFRLAGIQLEVPPLRERRDEIEAMVELFVARARSEWGTPGKHVTPEAMAALCNYGWPGNVRQLRYAVERAVSIAEGDAITLRDLPRFVCEGGAEAARSRPKPKPEQLTLKEQLRRYERALIQEALRRAAGNRQLAAKLLDIPLRTLFRKLRSLDVAEA